VGLVYLSGTAAAAVGLFALGVVTADAGWRFVRHGTVMAHEGAHAVIGSLLFRGVFGIYLNSDASGGTWVGGGGCLGSIVVSFAGYVGPSLFGLGAARLIQAGRGPAVLWVALVLLAVLAVLLMRSYGMITVVLAGALMYAVARYAPVAAQVTTAYGIAWLLLLSGVRRVLEVGVMSGDSFDLRSLTYVPRFVWFLLWLAATLGAVAAGGSMLVMPS
jgi:Peptidase M50B-like